MSSNPKVYTYYEPISKWEPDKTLVDLWVKNWSDRGFDPIVLSSNEAKQNKFYQEFTETISECFEKIMGRDIIIPSNPWSYYIFSNYIRFLCYANVDVSEPILIMDYDVYNIDYEVSEHKKIGNNLIFHFENCPCLVSGIPEKFQEMCNIMSQACKNYANLLMTEFEKTTYAAFHEMALMHCLRHSQNKILSNLISDLNISFIPSNKSILSKNMIHVSNTEFQNYCKLNEIVTKDLSHSERISIRLKIAEKAINK